MRILLAISMLLIMLIWQMPASLFDAGIDRFTRGGLRIAKVDGSVWHGQGVLMAIDPVLQTWQPWLALEWFIVGTNLQDGAFSWKISSSKLQITQVEVGINGITISHTKLRGPARFILERIPHGAGRAGWRGDITLSSAGFRCSWKAHCNGRIEIVWIDAATDLLPEQQLGDYQLTLDGDKVGVLLHLRTLRGPIFIDGKGRYALDMPLNFKGTIKGDDKLLQRLPSIAGSWIRPSEEAGAWIVTAP